MLSVILCSVDSFLASLGIGLLGCSGTNRRKLILAFAACDLGATLGGASLHLGLSQSHRGGLGLWLAPVAFAVVAVAVSAYSRIFTANYLWVPVLLGLDNFISGLLDGSTRASRSSLIAGLASGLLAWSGFATARVAGHLFSRRSAFVASASLMILAFVL